MQQRWDDAGVLCKSSMGMLFLMYFIFYRCGGVEKNFGGDGQLGSTIGIQKDSPSWSPSGSIAKIHQDPPPRSNRIHHHYLDPPGPITKIHEDSQQGSNRTHNEPTSGCSRIHSLDPPRSTMLMNQDPPCGSTRIHHWYLLDSTTWINQDPQLGSTRIHNLDPPGSTTRIHKNPALGSTRIHHVDLWGSNT